MSVREYVGARYVPKFKVPLEHDPKIAYEPLTVVTSESGKGNSYISRCYIPPNTPLTDDKWVLTYNWDAQVFGMEEKIRNKLSTTGGKMTGDIDMGGHKIKVLGDPTESTDAVNKKYVDKLYPVGTVYISYVNKSPAEFIGGTWLEIKGAFPYFNGGTATGGSNTHTMLLSELARHNHRFNNSELLLKEGGTIPSGYVLTGSSVFYTTEDGESKSFSIMPSYQTFYAWRRTA